MGNVLLPYWVTEAIYKAYSIFYDIAPLSNAVLARSQAGLSGTARNIIEGSEVERDIHTPTEVDTTGNRQVYLRNISIFLLAWSKA